MFSNIKKSLDYVSFIAYKKNLRVTKISDEPCLEFTEGASFLWDTSLVVDKINEKTLIQTCLNKLCTDNYTVCAPVRPTLKWYYDESRIFPILAILKHKK